MGDKDIKELLWNQKINQRATHALLIVVLAWVYVNNTLIVYGGFDDFRLVMVGFLAVTAIILSVSAFMELIRGYNNG